VGDGQVIKSVTVTVVWPPVIVVPGRLTVVVMILVDPGAVVMIVVPA
jgi:hypothetical protein